MNKILMAINLQLFDGEGGAASAGTGAPAGNAPAESGPATQTQEKNHLSEALGIPAPQAQETARTPDGQEQQSAQDQLTNEWNEAKKRYKDLYEADLKQTMDKRFKNQKDLQGQLDSMQPMLNALYQQRGITPGDLNALSDSIVNDEAWLEEEAMKRGMSVDAFKDFQVLQAEHDQRQAIEQQNIEAQMFQQHLQSLAQQAEQLKQLYPGLDLRNELMTNEEFARLTSPGVGVSVQRAYEVTHPEIQPMLMAQAAQTAQQKVVQSIQANGMRPAEAGLQNQAAAEVSFDPRKLTDDQYERVRNLIMKGKYVSFD